MKSLLPELIHRYFRFVTLTIPDQLALIENYPRARFAILDRSGHLLPVEQGTIFTTLLHRVEEYTSRS